MRAAAVTALACFFASHSALSSEAIPQGAVDQIADAAGVVADTAVHGVTHPYQYFGLDIGSARLMSKEKAEIDKTGSTYVLHTTTSFDFDAFVLDGGLGFFSAQVKGSSATKSNEMAEVATLMLNAAMRFRLTDKIQLGPVGALLFGSASDFGPTEKANTYNGFIGASASWEPSQDRSWRILLTYLRDQTIKTRDFSSVTIGAQWGLSWFKTNEPVANEETPIVTEIDPPAPAMEVVEESPAPPPEEPMAVQEQEVEVPDVLVLESDVVNFQSGSAKLNAGSMIYLSNLGKVLAAAGTEWEGSLMIEGHADSSGRKERQVPLSHARAESVMQVLHQAGVPLERMNAKGFGASVPLDESETPEALAKNRRVELRFDGFIAQSVIADLKAVKKPE